METTRPKNWVTSTGQTTRALNKSVLMAARERFDHLYENFDRVVVSFSGGKDSTTALFLALEAAERHGRLPVDVLHFDEEVIDPDTMDYIESLVGRDDLNLYWLCLPVRHILKSDHRNYWWPWDPEERDVWAREKPTHEYHLQGWDERDRDDQDIPKAATYFIKQHWPDESVAEVVGIRIQESFNRRRSLMHGGWMSDRGSHVYAKPIYDWGWQDVWRAIRQFDWPYSAFYDKAFMAGITPHWQRVAPWGNASQSREVQFWPAFYPDFWQKAIRRLPELRAQERYGNTKMFRQVYNKPDGMTWQEFTWALINAFEDESTREFWIKHIRNVVLKWRAKNPIPFPDEHPIIDGKKESLQSWKRLAMIVAKNDLQGRDKT